MTITLSDQEIKRQAIKIVNRLGREVVADFQIVGRGFDNASVKISDIEVLRLPIRREADRYIQIENRWLPVLQNHLTIKIPVPTIFGPPFDDLPFHWAILPWIEGDPADMQNPDSSELKAIAHFVEQLSRIPIPKNPPVNIHRQILLGDNPKGVEERIETLKKTTNDISKTVVDAWRLGCEQKVDLPPRWIFGDLHPGNVIVKGGHISGIIDWGNMCISDQAIDIAGLWTLFKAQEDRVKIFRYFNYSESTIIRAKGWAIFFGVILLEAGYRTKNRRAESIGRSIIYRIDEN